MMRRLIRDFYYRSCEVKRAVVLWEGVREHEIEHVLHYEETADMVINSYLPYEPCVLKDFAEKLVVGLDDKPMSKVAKDTVCKMKEFMSISKSMVPDGSILKEFI